jgi:signal recognition particle receptor subunit beta
MSIVTLNNRGVRSVTTFGSVNAGSMVFIKKLTASSSASLSFVNGSSDVVLDSTYKEYVFTFKNIHPGTDNKQLTVGFRDGDTDYDAVKTTTLFIAYHEESGSSSGIFYSTTYDLAQSTAFQPITGLISANETDANGCGYLHLFNPSSTTFVKHFIASSSCQTASDEASHDKVAGYINTTTAIDAVQFKMSSGNIDAGDICLYGIL